MYSPERGVQIINTSTLPDQEKQTLRRDLRPLYNGQSYKRKSVWISWTVSIIYTLKMA